MRRNIYNSIYYCILGLVLIALSLFALIYRENFLMRVFDLLGWILIVNGLHEFSNYYRKRLKGSLISVISNIFAGIFIIGYTAIPMRLVLIIFSLYITFNGIITLISYLNYKKDRVSYRFPVLCGALLLIIYGIALLVGRYANTRNMMIFIGAYGLLLGINYVVDGIFVVIPQQKKDSLKRRIRIPIPLLISALIPKTMMDYINERLQIEPKEHFLNPNETHDIEILIHASADGFGTVGHCDVCIDDKVISYGNYDHDSIRMFEAIGDGVVFIANREHYLNFCIQNYQQTIFAYGVSLSTKQLSNVKNELNKLMVNTYQWFPRSYYNKNDCNDYASKLYLSTNANFYKFKKGKFKTYFVLGSNCVKLVEHIVGKGGLDIIDLNGIISPGTYQNYLEKEYQRVNGVVVSKNVYNRLTFFQK